MNQLKQSQKTIFSTVTEHRGRSLEEQIIRHRQATGHTKQGDLQVREEKYTLPNGNKATKIIVYQECLECDMAAFNSDGTQPDLDELQAMTNKQLVALAQSIGARGHKQMNKNDLIESIVDTYENTAIITNS